MSPPPKAGLRVLIVSQYFWPESFRINDLALALRQRGHDVVVLTGLPNYPHGRFFPGYGLRGPWRETWEGIPVVRVPLTPRGASRGWALALNFASFAGSAILFGLPRTGPRFDVVFVYEVSPITVALPAIALRRLRGTPIVLWVQDLWPDNLLATGSVRSPSLLRPISSLVRWIYSRADRILAESNAFIPRIEAQDVDPQRISYLPNWAETLYQPVELERGAPEEADFPQGFRIVFAGNIGVSQDFATILEAAEELRENADIQWVILGEGRMRPWVEKEVAKRGLEKVFHLLGHRPVTSMPRYLALADVLLISLRRDDLYSLMVPSKLQSSMACGKPIIAAADGEVARIVNEAEGGIAVPAGSPESLAEAIRKLSRLAPSKLEAMGANNRRYFEHHFERERLIDKVESVLYKLASEEYTA